MTNTLVIARRKGVKVRMFNTSTAKMGPWVTDPIAEAAKADRVRLAERKATQARMAKLRKLPVVHTQSTLEAYTRSQIALAGEVVLHMQFPGRMRKADMIAAYLAAQTEAMA